MDLFHSLHEDRKKTIVFITHSRELAEETQRTVTIRDGQIIREERRNDHGSMGEYRTGCELSLIHILADAFTALATFAAFLAFQAGHESLSLLMDISFLRSMGQGFQSPAVNALYPDIVPEHQLVRINGINQTINNILLLISPAAGGVILGTLGIKWAFCIDVITAAAAIGIMSGMKIDVYKRQIW